MTGVSAVGVLVLLLAAVLGLLFVVALIALFSRGGWVAALVVFVLGGAALPAAVLVAPLARPQQAVTVEAHVGPDGTAVTQVHREVSRPPWSRFGEPGRTAYGVAAVAALLYLLYLLLDSITKKRVEHPAVFVATVAVLGACVIMLGH